MSLVRHLEMVDLYEGPIFGPRIEGQHFEE